MSTVLDTDIVFTLEEVNLLLSKVGTRSNEPTHQEANLEFATTPVEIKEVE
jgi:hypothetical protein